MSEKPSGARKYEPACPACGLVDDRQPDPLGVYLCRSCWIEFRPRARYGFFDDDKIWVMLVLVGLILGVLIAIANAKPAPDPTQVPSPRYTPPAPTLEIPPPPQIELPQIELPPLELPPPELPPPVLSPS